ncbi:MULTISPECIES: hypothetical protein [Bacillaceae]|uniref:Uncharacterized protein n=1 Tax=Ectobacillus funiculus TaxID=137993 RepID=A0ABV5WL66_9BACI
MFSLLVGLILLVFLLIGIWVIAGKLGAFDFMGNVAAKIKNFFKEEKK